MVYPYISLYLYNILSLGYAKIGVLLLLISIIPLAVSPFGGLIADRAGRRRVFLLSLSGEACSIFLIAESMLAAWLPGVLIGGIAAGVSGSIAGPAVSAYVADFAVGSDRSKAFTWLRIGFNGGFTVGVALGSVLIGYLGYATTGLASSGILAAGVLFLFLLLDPSPYDLDRQGLDPAAERDQQQGPGSIRESVSILVNDRKFLVLCLASTLTGLVYGHWSTTFPLFVNTILKVPIWTLGMALALNGAIVTLGQTLTTRMMIGRRHTTAAILGTLLYGVSFIALGGLSLFAPLFLVAVFGFVVILTVGENLGSIPSMTLPSNMAPKSSELGSYNGVYGMLSGIGGNFSPALGGLILASVPNTLLIWVILAIPAIPAVLLYRWLSTRVPPTANKI
jgi:MFS family permease